MITFLLAESGGGGGTEYSFVVVVIAMEMTSLPANFAKLVNKTLCCSVSDLAVGTVRCGDVNVGVV